ncbi:MULTISPECIES: hypothetical protein [unclassified Rhodococcus (in: high G+C Gram-positive bacteria)]|uniref:hypothetical protein n=1 Tax=unclassified Rhodococcus (in: high G+C Gram-positive bacteria) TaxID=192944 RepID=UPI00117A2FA5|nr:MULTISPECIES: hypothetical protein [unclassified Rhodococcus (in: high G+C Gram-positive bacteria)]
MRTMRLGGVLTAIIGLFIGIIAACPLAERTVLAEGSPLAHTAPATADQRDAIGKSPGCRKDPAAPVAPIQAGVPHREDLRIPLAAHHAPAPVMLGRSIRTGSGPVDTNGPPSPALDLTTILRI